MLPEKLPLPSKYGHENDPQTKEEWEEYFACRQKYDQFLDQETKDQLTKQILTMDYSAGNFANVGKGNPLDPDYAYNLKTFSGLKSIQEFNLSEAKHRYPDEF